MKEKLLQEGKVLADDWEEEQVRLAAEKRQRERERKARAKIPKLLAAREGKSGGSRATNLPSLGRMQEEKEKNTEEEDEEKGNGKDGDDDNADGQGDSGGGMWGMFTSLFAWSNPEEEYMLDDGEWEGEEGEWEGQGEEEEGGAEGGESKSL